MYNQIYHI